MDARRGFRESVATEFVAQLSLKNIKPPQPLQPLQKATFTLLQQSGGVHWGRGRGRGNCLRRRSITVRLGCSGGHNSTAQGPLTHTRVKELFLTRSELQSMAPVERLLRAYVTEHQLEPVSVLEGAVVRLKQAGRFILYRVLTAREHGAHMQLILEGCKQAALVGVCSNTDPFASKEAFEQLGRAELEGLVAARQGLQPLPIEQVAQQAWRITVGKAWGREFESGCHAKGPQGLYRDLRMPKGIAQKVLHLDEAIVSQLQPQAATMQHIASNGGPAAVHLISCSAEMKTPATVAAGTGRRASLPPTSQPAHLGSQPPSPRGAAAAGQRVEQVQQRPPAAVAMAIAKQVSAPTLGASAKQTAAPAGGASSSDSRGKASPSIGAGGGVGQGRQLHSGAQLAAAPACEDSLSPGLGAGPPAGPLPDALLGQEQLGVGWDQLQQKDSEGRPPAGGIVLPQHVVACGDCRPSPSTAQRAAAGCQDSRTLVASTPPALTQCGGSPPVPLPSELDRAEAEPLPSLRPWEGNLPPLPPLPPPEQDAQRREQCVPPLPPEVGVLQQDGYSPPLPPLAVGSTLPQLQAGPQLLEQPPLPADHLPPDQQQGVGGQFVGPQPMLAMAPGAGVPMLGPGALQHAQQGPAGKFGALPLQPALPQTYAWPGLGFQHAGAPLPPALQQEGPAMQLAGPPALAGPQLMLNGKFGRPQPASPALPQQGSRVQLAELPALTGSQRGPSGQFEGSPALAGLQYGRFGGPQPLPALPQQGSVVQLAGLPTLAEPQQGQFSGSQPLPALPQQGPAVPFLELLPPPEVHMEPVDAAVEVGTEGSLERGKRQRQEQPRQQDKRKELPRVGNTIPAVPGVSHRTVQLFRRAVRLRLREAGVGAGSGRKFSVRLGHLAPAMFSLGDGWTAAEEGMPFRELCRVLLAHRVLGTRGWMGFGVHQSDWEVVLPPSRGRDWLQSDEWEEAEGAGSEAGEGIEKGEEEDGMPQARHTKRPR